MFVPLPTDVSDEDTREESIFSVKSCVEKQEHTRKVLEHEYTTKDEVNLGQEGKFPYDSRCAEGEFIIPVIAQKVILPPLLYSF